MPEPSGDTGGNGIDRLQVTVAYAATPRGVQQIDLVLPAGATVRNALDAAELDALCPLIDRLQLAVAIWGRRALADQALIAGDRVELCRPLLVDPKAARRERFAQQGARAAGLFSGRSGERGETTPSGC